MEVGSEGKTNRHMNNVKNNNININNNNNNGQSDKFKTPRRQRKTPQQLLMLEQTYASEMNPSEATRAKLSKDLGLTDRQLQMWFCNRRVKDKKEGSRKRVLGEGSGGERMDLMKDVMVVDCSGRSDHGSWSSSGSGLGLESDSSQVEQPVVCSKAYELTQQEIMCKRIIEVVEVQLGESLKEDGPALGIEFDEPILSKRLTPSTYRVRLDYKKDPTTADEVISLTKEKIQTFTNGFLAGVNVEDVKKEEDHEEAAEGAEIDDFAALSTSKDNFLSEDVKTSVHKDVDTDMKMDINNTAMENLPKSATMRLAKDLGSNSALASAASKSNASLEAANILGQIASQAYCRQSIPHTLTPMEIDSRIEKEVTTRVASHFDSLRVEMEERMQAMNAKQETMLADIKAKEGSVCVEASAKEKDWFNSRRQKDKKQGIVNRSHSGSDSIQSNEHLDSGDGDIKSKMINVLMKENKRDEAKCRLLMDQCRHLTKSIEDRKKLIDGIKKIG